MTRPNQKMDKPWWRENWELGNHRPRLLAFWPPYAVVWLYLSDAIPNATFQLFQVLIYDSHNFQQTNKGISPVHDRNAQMILLRSLFVLVGNACLDSCYLIV
jgi:hypothetical protein